MSFCRPRYLSTVGASLLMLTACNMNRLTANMTAGPIRAGSIALDREADLDFAATAIPASLKTVETFLVNAPDNRDLLFLCARGYNSYAFGFLERELEKARIDGTNEDIERLTRRAVLHYLRGREYAFMLLDRPELERAARAGDVKAVERELASVGVEDVPGLFWAAYGWASAINLSQSDPDMVGSLQVVEAMMQRVVTIAPDYEAGSPLLFQGVYYASKPAMAGGDPVKAKEYFDRAMKSHGARNLLVPYMYARYYGTQVQDGQLFASMMRKVLEGDVVQYPDLRLQNEIARDLGAFWSANADELILE